MELIDILHRYYSAFKTKHGRATTQDQWSALNAMLGCRTAQYGEIALSCQQCDWSGTLYQSCGHRSCNQCQNHTTTQWLERQTQKLLPVRYFMVTFTIPFELRPLAKTNQAVFYSLMFKCSAAALKQFAANDRQLSCELGMTGVLHTHSRQLSYHPHIHFVVPAGGVNKARNEWRKRKGKYLFKEQNLAKVFRAMLLKELKLSGLALPRKMPTEWIADCEDVGHGLSALKYLSRYLYRGVIGNKNIIRDDGKNVTFQYINSGTGLAETRVLPGADFIKLLVQHTLPKGFRRVRDYGFLHGNAKQLLKLVQFILKVSLPAITVKERPPFRCNECKGQAFIVAFIKPKRLSG